MTEFELIARFFAPSHDQPDIHLGIGDDAAVCHWPSGQSLVMTMDTLNENVHFLPQTPADLLAYKALAVNVSDLIAMGALPWCYCLSLCLPEVAEPWLHDFSRGLREAESKFGVRLVGGDTTRGPLSICIHMSGAYPADTPLLTRASAQIGDIIYVTGTLGLASHGLAVEKAKTSTNRIGADPLTRKYHRPEPPLALIAILRQYAHAAIDISDGLVQDLGHVCRQSGLGARLYASDLPVASELAHLASPHAQALALQGGDEYELCCTVAAGRAQAFEAAAAAAGVCVTAIGSMQHAQGVTLIASDGTEQILYEQGWQHFC